MLFKFFRLFFPVFLTLISVNTSEGGELKRTKLPNGLTIATKPITSNNIVSVEVTARMGSLYETDEQAGISTLMQDTILKGTTNRTSEQIALETESMGTHLSSSAEREYGSISMQSTSQSLMKSMEILFDVIKNPNFPEDALEVQKRIQIQNIMVRRDQPLSRAIELMVEAHYGEHPFHKSVLGYPETVAELSRDELEAYHKLMYQPVNMVITVVGNFDEKSIIEEITKNLGDIEAGQIPQRVGGEQRVITEPVENKEERETAASWFILGWPSPPLGSPEYFAMEVLNGITGGSMSSRLFVAIREKRGLAYQVSSLYSSRKESGLYGAYIGTRPDNYEEAKNVLLEEVTKMSAEAASKDEIHDTKSFLRGLNIMQQESNSGQAAKYGRYEILGLGFEFVDVYNEGIEKITAEDIMQVAVKYLTGPWTLGGVIAK